MLEYGPETPCPSMITMALFQAFRLSEDEARSHHERAAREGKSPVMVCCKEVAETKSAQANKVLASLKVLMCGRRCEAEFHHEPVEH